MIGQTISHYRIVEMLGGGGMGVARAFFEDELRPLRRPCRPTRSPAIPRLSNASTSSSRRLCPKPSQYLHYPRNWQARRTILHRHGIPRWRDLKHLIAASANGKRNRTLAGHRNCRWPRCGPPPRASFIATSSQRTPSSPARRRWHFDFASPKSKLPCAASSCAKPHRKTP